VDELTMNSMPKRPPSNEAARTRRRRGFSLLEAVVALGILSVGVLAIAASATTALKYAQRSRSLTQAMYLAEQQIETFAAMTGPGVLGMLAAPTYPNDPANPIDPDPLDPDLTSFNRSWTIQQDTPEAGTMTLTVQVTWVDASGAARNVQLQTVKSSL